MFEFRTAESVHTWKPWGFSPYFAGAFDGSLYCDPLSDPIVAKPGKLGMHHERYFK